MAHTVYSAIQAIYGAFTSGTRPNGDTYYFIADDKKEDWMQELCMDAHLSQMPGDIEYDVIHTFISALSELDEDDIEDMDSLVDHLQDYTEPDVYNSDLLQWLSSNLSYIAYCDEAMQDFGGFDDLMSIIQAGQQTWKQAIAYAICQYFDNNFEYSESEEDSDD